jgi:hypothetical protein
MAFELVQGRSTVAGLALYLAQVQDRRRLPFAHVSAAVYEQHLPVTWRASVR